MAPNGAPIRKQEYNCVFIKIDIPTAAFQTRTWRLIFHFSYSAVSLLKCKTFFLNQKQCPMPNAVFLKSNFYGLVIGYHRCNHAPTTSWKTQGRCLRAEETYIMVTNTGSQTMSCLKSAF